MRRQRHTSIEDLRAAIDCMPVDTRVAMLEGVRSNEIIVGAYVDRQGGVCPMLAAHRCGGRTDFRLFARTWDRFTGAGASARRATRRELRILVSHLEVSLLAEHDLDLPAAIREHREQVGRHTPLPSTARPGEPSRATELRARPGWSWLRPFRRLDEFERALARAQAQREAPALADAWPQPARPTAAGSPGRRPQLSRR